MIIDDDSSCSTCCGLGRVWDSLLPHAAVWHTSGEVGQRLLWVPETLSGCPWSLYSQVYRLATRRIKIHGTQVVAVPLFEALDCMDLSDYVQRVEPSAKGGAKMAQLIIDSIPGTANKAGVQAASMSRDA